MPHEWFDEVMNGEKIEIEKGRSEEDNGRFNLIPFLPFELKTRKREMDGYEYDGKTKEGLVFHSVSD